MTRASLYLSRDRHGTYHFRARVPANLRHHFNNKSEIKRSLKTDSRREAVRLARAYRVELDKMIEELTAEEAREALGKLRAISPFVCARVIKAERPVIHDDGTVETVSAKVVREGMGPGEDSTKLRREMLEQLREEGRDKIDQKRNAEIHKTKLAAIASTTAAPAPQHQPTQPTSTSPLLFDAIKLYCREKVNSKRWTPKTETLYRAVYSEMLEVLGNVSLDLIDRKSINLVLEKIAKLPANRHHPAFKGKSVDELLKMPNIKTRSDGTVSLRLDRMREFFGWAESSGYITRNPAKGITYGSKSRQPHEERDIFTGDELQRMFGADEYRAQKHRNSWNAWNYWVPIIGLYTGARLEEICQLHVADIKQVGGVWVFDINDNGTASNPKGLKNAPSRRQVPIHPKIIDLGFLDFHESVKRAGHVRLFHELRHHAKNKYQHNVGKWFTDYRKRHGVGTLEEEKGKKCFHSFRHTFVNHLRQNRIAAEHEIQAIIGHKNDRTIARYGDPLEVKTRHEIISRIDFGLSHPPFIVSISSR